MNPTNPIIHLDWYPSIKLAAHPRRDPNVQLRLEFSEDKIYHQFQENAHGMALMDNWMAYPSRKFYLSDWVYNTIDSNEDIRNRYFQFFAQTPVQMGVL